MEAVARGETGAGAGALVFGCCLSSSCFFPNFQKSRLRGFELDDCSADWDGGAALESPNALRSKGAPESLDSVLGALALSFMDGSLEDMTAVHQLRYQGRLNGRNRARVNVRMHTTGALAKDKGRFKTAAGCSTLQDRVRAKYSDIQGSKTVALD